MEDYKAYLIVSDGRIAGRVDLLCENDCVAKERAQQLALDCPVELWRGQRKIAEYEQR